MKMNDIKINKEKSALCIICGKTSQSIVNLASSRTRAPTSSLPLHKLLKKVVGEEINFSVSKYSCHECLVLLSKFDAYQAKTEEFQLLINDKYRQTKCQFLKNNRPVSKLLESSLTDIKKYNDGTTLNFNRELSVTIFHDSRLTDNESLTTEKPSKRPRLTNGVSSQSSRDSPAEDQVSIEQGPVHLSNHVDERTDGNADNPTDSSSDCSEDGSNHDGEVEAEVVECELESQESPQLNPQLAQAVLLQNSFATDLLQSFLSSSLWLNPGGSNSDVGCTPDSQPNQSLVTADSLFETSENNDSESQRLELKNTGRSYFNTKGKLVEAKKILPQDCSRCPLKCNNRVSDKMRVEIFSSYWKLGNYDLQRKYLASHMERGERIGPSGPRISIHYYLTHEDQKIQVCRQFFQKTLDVSEKTSRIVLNKMKKET